ncbi:15708_t:CDS:2, partial [Rhizophagus irregularis]
MNSKALVKLKLTSQKLDLRVRKFSMYLKTLFFQYSVDGLPEECQNSRLQNWVPSKAYPAGRTKDISIRKQIQIKNDKTAADMKDSMITFPAPNLN